MKSPKSVTTVSMSKVETIQLFIQNILSHLISDAMHWRLGILWQKETKGRGGMAGNQDQLHIRLWQNEKYVIVQTDWPFEFDCDHYTTSSCGNNKMQKKLRWEYGCQFLKEDIKCHHWKVRMKSPTFPSHFFTFSYCSSYMYLWIYNFLFFIPVDYYGNWNPFKVKTSVVQDDARAGRQARDLSSTDDRKRSGKLII